MVVKKNKKNLKKINKFVNGKKISKNKINKKISKNKININNNIITIKKKPCKVKLSTKRRVFNNFNLNVKNFDFFNVSCGNVFKNFLSVGQRNYNEINIIMQKYLGNFEYLILTFILNFESGRLNKSEASYFLEKNKILNNIYFFLVLLKSLTWEDFCRFTDKLNLQKDSINLENSNITLITLDTLKKILNLKDLVKSLINGNINEEHFKIAIKKYKFNKNLSAMLLNLNVTNYFNNLDLVSSKFNMQNIFSNITVGFYDAVISKYTKYFLYTKSGSKDNLSYLLKKHRHYKLNQAKNRDVLSYIHNLALAYIGDPFTLPFAPKPINLKYRAYRIFLYTFKMKPFKLWQLSRKSRKHKHGGLLADHLSKYELTVQNILLLSNFCLNLPEVKTYLNKGKICVNGKIILSNTFVIRPFDVIHFIEDIFREERDRFLLNIASAMNKNIFNKEFSKLFEYNFKSFCCTMLPNFFNFRNINFNILYSEYNSGRFKIQKI